MLDERDFRRAMSQFASGVSVVTVASESELCGLTVSSLTSLSLNPPLVGVSIGKAAAKHDQFITANRYAVSILAGKQAAISDYFARMGDKPDFEAVHRLRLPLIDGALAHLTCEVVNVHEVGDHSLLVGRVDWASCGAQCPPLLRFRSKYV